MYKLKNYLLSMQSHWMINQNTYNAVQETMPLVTKFRAGKGTEPMGKTPVHQIAKKVFPDVYTVPLFRRHFCKLLMKEIELMKREIKFEGNEDEDNLRQIPEIVLLEHCPTCGLLCTRYLILSLMHSGKEIAKTQPAYRSLTTI